MNDSHVHSITRYTDYLSDCREDPAVCLLAKVMQQLVEATDTAAPMHERVATVVASLSNEERDLLNVAIRGSRPIYAER